MVPYCCKNTFIGCQVTTLGRRSLIDSEICAMISQSRARVELQKGDANCWDSLIRRMMRLFRFIIVRVGMIEESTRVKICMWCKNRAMDKSPHVSARCRCEGPGHGPWHSASVSPSKVKRVHAKLVISFSKWWSVMTYAAILEFFASWSFHAARSAEWEKVVCRIRCCSQSGKKEMY
jgi:hypothetical protein